MAKFVNIASVVNIAQFAINEIDCWQMISGNVLIYQLSTCNKCLQRKHIEVGPFVVLLFNSGASREYKPGGRTCLQLAQLRDSGGVANGFCLIGCTSTSTHSRQAVATSVTAALSLLNFHLALWQTLTNFEEEKSQSPYRYSIQYLI